MMPGYLRALICALLLAFSISAFALAILLISLIGRFAKDLNEVFWTWQYVQNLLAAGLLLLVGCGLARRQSRNESKPGA